MNETIEPVTICDEPGAVTIRITGSAFSNLCEIARIVSQWTEREYTPGGIVDKFLCAGGDWYTLADKNADYPDQTLAGMICDCYRADPDMPKLEKALKDAGFSCAS